MPFSIWISGTNGKTTTTQMCQHILKGKERFSLWRKYWNPCLLIR
ncbi:MAG: Mur ligase family protein [Halarcobacter sp.]